MNERIIVIGAGGHGKVVADIAQKSGCREVAFVDDRATGSPMGIPIIGTAADLPALNDGRTGFVIAIGSNAFRQTLAERYAINWVTLVHPSAQIGAGVTLGRGTVVLANAVINPCVQIGAHCIINTCAVIEHDNIIGDYTHISPNAALGGTVTVGSLTHIGIGAAIRNNIRITDNCVIGAGACVVSDLTEPGTYIGVPARKMDKT